MVVLKTRLRHEEKRLFDESGKHVVFNAVFIATGADVHFVAKNIGDVLMVPGTVFTRWGDPLGIEHIADLSSIQQPVDVLVKDEPNDGDLLGVARFDKNFYSVSPMPIRSIFNALEAVETSRLDDMAVDKVLPSAALDFPALVVACPQPWSPKRFIAVTESFEQIYCDELATRKLA